MIFFAPFLFALLGSSFVFAQSTVDFSSLRVTGDRETNDLVHLRFDAHLMPMEQNWRCTADLRSDLSTSLLMGRSKTVSYTPFFFFSSFDQRRKGKKVPMLTVTPSRAPANS